MAAAKKSRRSAAETRSPEQQYIHGSAAPKLEAKPERERRTRREQSQSATVRRNQERALQMNIPYVLLLMAAAICTLYLCVSYLQLQSSISTRLRNIESLESTVEQLRSDNDALETRINTSVDLDYVYKVATEELDMVYANKNQVRLYNRSESEYVRQYEDIPEW